MYVTPQTSHFHAPIARVFPYARASRPSPTACKVGSHAHMLYMFIKVYLQLRGFELDNSWVGLVP